VDQVLDELLCNSGAGSDGDDPVLLVGVVQCQIVIVSKSRRSASRNCGSTFRVTICTRGSFSVTMRNTLPCAFHTSRCGVNGCPLVTPSSDAAVARACYWSCSPERIIVLSGRTFGGQLAANVDRQLIAWISESSPQTAPSVDRVAADGVVLRER